MLLSSPEIEPPILTQMWAPGVLTHNWLAAQIFAVLHSFLSKIRFAFSIDYEKRSSCVSITITGYNFNFNFNIFTDKT